MDPTVLTKHVLRASRKPVWAVINHSAQFGGCFDAEIMLADGDGGTARTIAGSGFERLPPQRRRKSMVSNERSRTHQAAPGDISGSA